MLFKGLEITIEEKDGVIHYKLGTDSNPASASDLYELEQLLKKSWNGGEKTKIIKSIKSE
jgi:hypothetical protein